MRPRGDASAGALPDDGLPPEAAVFALAGELDVASVHALARLHRLAVRGEEECLVVDLTETTFVDVTIARLVAAAAHQAAARGVRVAIACRTPAVLRLLDLVEADRAAEIHPDLVGALRALEALPGRIEHVRGGGRR